MVLKVTGQTDLSYKNEDQFRKAVCASHYYMFCHKTYFLVFKTNIWEDSEMIREVLIFVAIWMQNPKQHHLFKKATPGKQRAEVILKNALT